MDPVRRNTALTLAAITLTLGAALTGCSADSASSGGKITVVGAENEYADVAAQLGGSYVEVTSIMSDPNTDPHTFEASASVAKTIAAAQLIVQNGLGYDDFMTKLEKASPDSSRKVVVAQDVLGLPDTTENPHLWYDPKTMPAVAKKITDELSAIQPAHKDYFAAQLATFDAALTPWTDAIGAFKQQHSGTPVAVTEPVADYLLDAAGVAVKTPWSFQAAIMNDTDPSPQDSATQEALFTGKAIKVFLYNQQVTDTITSHFLDLSKANGVPVVGVYETMPSGYHYQQWMQAELSALASAITSGTSTEKL